MAGSLTSAVNRLSGESVELCYHCHKCAAGCRLKGGMPDDS